MNTRTTFILLLLFFAGLLAVWWLDYHKIPTQSQRQRLAGVVLPELAEVAPGEIKRIEVLGDPKGKIAFERRDAGHWQMVEPVVALANQSLLETLLRNLRGLRSVPGAETLKAAPNTFVVGQPERTLRLFEADSQKPVVTLELGKKIESRRYVRNAAGQGIEVVDAKLLGALELPPVDWREKALFTLSTFEVDGLAISGAGRDMQAQRIEGRWRLVRPYKALLEPGKVEGVMAALASLRVAGGAQGFVADEVRDFSPYGLDQPRLRFELDPEPSAGKPQVVEIGKDVPGAPGKAYARRADQNDVVLVETKMILDLGSDPQVLRSQRIAELDFDLIYCVQLLINGQQHLLGLGPEGWRVLEPSFGRADSTAVRELLGRLNDLKTSEFLDPAKTPKTELEKPWAVVKVWQHATKVPETAEPPTQAPKADPALTLVLGRYNVLGKAVYALADGAPTVLVLPDSLLQVLPNGPLGYRERTLLALSPNDIDRLTVERDGKVFEVRSGPSPGRFEQWKMTRPAAGPADTQTVAQLMVMLANLRADQLITDAPQDLARYGLDSPVISCTWSVPRPGMVPAKAPAAKQSPLAEWTLSVGKPVAGKQGSHFARLSGNPVVFTLSAVAIQLLS
jgi:hypothetical protein